MQRFTRFALVSCLSSVLLSGCFGPNHMKTVQNGVLPNNTTVSVGGVFKGYEDCLNNTQKWTRARSTQGARLVQFSCQLKSAQTYFAKAHSFQKDVDDIAQSVTNFAKNLTGNHEKVQGGRKPVTQSHIFNPQETRLVVEFAIDKIDPKKFTINGIFIEPNWEGKKVQVEINARNALENIYANQPIFGANFSSLEFTNKLHKAYNARR